MSFNCHHRRSKYYPSSLVGFHEVGSPMVIVDDFDSSDAMRIRAAPVGGHGPETHCTRGSVSQLKLKKQSKIREIVIGQKPLFIFVPSPPVHGEQSIFDFPVI